MHKYNTQHGLTLVWSTEPFPVQINPSPYRTQGWTSVKFNNHIWYQNELNSIFNLEGNNLSESS